VRLHSIVFVSVALLCTACIFGGWRKPEPIRDGFALSGADGKLIASETAEKFFFAFDTDITDGRGRIPAGESIELLYSSALEKILTGAEDRVEKGYRIWGVVTKYKTENYIFPVYFLPVTEVKRIKPAPSEKSPTVVNAPEDAVKLPEEIVAKLQRRKIIRSDQLKKGLELKQDSILADRIGFIEKDAAGRLEFTLDALGRNIQQVSFALLPCRILEIAEIKQAAELEKPRFKVAGIVTKYKDKYCLLLQRARKVYSHGNFN